MHGGQKSKGIFDQRKLWKRNPECRGRWCLNYQNWELHKEYSFCTNLWTGLSGGKGYSKFKKLKILCGWNRVRRESWAEAEEDEAECWKDKGLPCQEARWRVTLCWLAVAASCGQEPGLHRGKDLSVLALPQTRRSGNKVLVKWWCKYLNSKHSIDTQFYYYYYHIMLTYSLSIWGENRVIVNICCMA